MATAPLKRLRAIADPRLGTESQDRIRDLARFEDGRCDRYRLYQEYYDGDHRARLNDRQRLYLQASGITFTENVCDTVIDKAAARLHVEAFQVKDNDQASDWLSTVVFGHSGGDELQGVVHTNTGLLGDAFLIVDWDDKAQLPRYRYNRPGLIKVVYDEDAGYLAEPALAVKKWASTKRTPLNPTGLLILRVNIFLPDRVEKWFSPDKEGQTWAPWTDEPDEAWPVPWTASGELPPDGTVADDALGVAVIHFRNRALGRAYGLSDLKKAIPWQEAHTKNVLDMFSVMDAQGWAWPWVTGVTDAETLTLGVGDILKLPNENAKVGQLPAADPQRLLPVIKGTLQRLATFTDTPLHNLLVEGALPSGESLKTAESGAVKKATAAQPALGNSWARANRMCLRLAAAHGDLPFAFDPEAQITTVWDSPETRDEVAEAATFEAYKRIGVSARTLIRELGYDPEEEGTQSKEEAQAKVEAAQAAFDAGAGGPPGRAVVPAKPGQPVPPQVPPPR